MRLKIKDKGKLIGRVVTEALPRGALSQVAERHIASAPAANGLMTVIDEQLVGATRYFDAAGFPGRTVGLTVPARTAHAQR
jgi:hypothetical protein